MRKNRALKDKDTRYRLFHGEWDPKPHADQVLKRPYGQWGEGFLEGPAPDKSWKEFGLLDVEGSEQLHLLLVPVCEGCRGPSRGEGKCIYLSWL